MSLCGSSSSITTTNVEDRTVSPIVLTSHDDARLTSGKDKLTYGLPPEVLYEIFFLCCPTYKDHFRGPPLTPLMLGHVCRSWRRAALNSPRLWTYLTLTVAYSSLGGMERACHQFNFWLERVRDCPILVEIEFVETPRRLPAANVFLHVKRLVHVAQSYKQSLGENEMVLRASLDATTAPQNQQAQVLEQYSWVKSGMRPDHPEPGSVQIHVTRHSEILYGLEGHSTLGKYIIHLDLRDPAGIIRLSAEECQTALSYFTELEFCALRIGPSAGEDLESLVLDHLRTLSLSWSEDVEIATLLESITTPSLGELELRGPVSPSRNLPIIHPLPDLLRRSTPPLRYVTLAGMDGTAVDIIHFLALVQGLRHLSLEHCRLDELFMDSLQFGEGAIHDLARLTITHLEYLGLIHCDIFGLNEFLRSSLEMRLLDEAYLERLYIIDSGPISDEVLIGMRQLPLDEFETDPAVLEDTL